MATDEASRTPLKIVEQLFNPGVKNFPYDEINSLAMFCYRIFAFNGGKHFPASLNVNPIRQGNLPTHTTNHTPSINFSF